MPSLQTTFSEPRTLPPFLVLTLLDRFTGRSRLVGLYDDPAEETQDQAWADLHGDTGRLRRHTTVRVSGRPKVPFRRVPEASFVFFDLPTAAHTIEVRSPYYLARDIVFPSPASALWPAFPDLTLANPNLPLEDPGQPAAYLAQRGATTLQPSATYPFPEGTTLIRGTVRAAGAPLTDALVSISGQEYRTGADGQYVFAIPKATVSGSMVVVSFTHSAHAAATRNVTAFRGTTSVQDVAMA